jgi:hypothetical protein
MTLKQAIEKAKEYGVFAVYRRSVPAILRGICTEFDAYEKRYVRDWDVLLPREARAK